MDKHLDRAKELLSGSDQPDRLINLNQRALWLQQAEVNALISLGESMKTLVNKLTDELPEQEAKE